jgi:hypothetical protein
MTEIKELYLIQLEIAVEWHPSQTGKLTEEVFQFYYDEWVDLNGSV